MADEYLSRGEISKGILSPKHFNNLFKEISNCKKSCLNDNEANDFDCDKKKMTKTVKCLMPDNDCKSNGKGRFPI